MFEYVSYRVASKPFFTRESRVVLDENDLEMRAQDIQQDLMHQSIGSIRAEWHRHQRRVEAVRLHHALTDIDVVRYAPSIVRNGSQSCASAG